MSKTFSKSVYLVWLSSAYVSTKHKISQRPYVEMCIKLFFNQSRNIDNMDTTLFTFLRQLRPSRANFHENGNDSTKFY